MLNNLRQVLNEERRKLYLKVNEMYVDSIINAFQDEDEYLLVPFFDLDEATQQHSLRTALYTCQLLDHINYFPPADYLMGFVLHDLGKLEKRFKSIITNNKTSLTAEERTIVKNHPWFGVNIINSFQEDLPAGILLSIMFHHERCDGKGYPFNISEYQLPIELKALSIADTFDAMVHRGIYQSKKPIDLVLAYLYCISQDECFTFTLADVASIAYRDKAEITIMGEMHGGQLDLELVDNFIKLFSNVKLRLS